MHACQVGRQSGFYIHEGDTQARAQAVLATHAPLFHRSNNAKCTRHSSPCLNPAWTPTTPSPARLPTAASFPQSRPCTCSLLLRAGYRAHQGHSIVGDAATLSRASTPLVRGRRRARVHHHLAMLLLIDWLTDGLPA
eukprot:51497-Chlamydomonas_euryale.AAC.3